MAGDQPYKIMPCDALPTQPQWLYQQTVPVIAVAEAADQITQSDSGYENADLIVGCEKDAEGLAARIRKNPQAALVLVQVLRAQTLLPTAAALDMESMAFATLQAGDEFKTWLESYRGSNTTANANTDTKDGNDQPAIDMDRQGDVLTAVLNRPQTRNSITVEMRDALVELLTIMRVDTSVQRLLISARGACFSVGGELAEFGSLINPSNAHWIRTVHSPARLMAEHSGRITCTVHGACIGSGIELPAFASQLYAHKKTFFQLPELAMGLIPGAGGTVSISRRIGRQKAGWWILSGKKITAQTALQWGLIDKLLD
ncbi:enoyl-CoA hydratase/isomerase family protein [Halioxenophilus aromaticivorans]|uniref:Enoyl-CoA hydratase/isomerase family protein n=1 Tax=Halioxenophilus aromaticivorans TaxID=1306992 RepID=A0AAV3U3Y3_9ALTE